MNKIGRAAVFLAPGKPFEIREYKVPDPQPGAMVIKIGIANICGSDLHAWHGRFQLSTLGGKMPTVLGHEMTGSVVALGPGLTKDSDGRPLREGDRVVFTYFTSCGHCPGCLRGLRVTCTEATMAMTELADAWPHFVGGFGDYYYVNPGAAVYCVPNGLPDEVVAGANCGLSQVIYGFKRANLQFDETVVIQGAGGLGLYATTVAKSFGARMVIVIDGVEKRLEIARRFGADATINISMLTDPAARVKQVKALTDGRGADVVIELVGSADVMPEGIRMLAQMGRYITIGNINGGQTYQADPSRLVLSNKRVEGVSLYEPHILSIALKFLNAMRNRLPLDEMNATKFPLSDINTAFRKADRREVVRASVVP